MWIIILTNSVGSLSRCSYYFVSFFNNIAVVLFLLIIKAFHPRPRRNFPASPSCNAGCYSVRILIIILFLLVFLVLHSSLSFPPVLPQACVRVKGTPLPTFRGTYWIVISHLPFCEISSQRAIFSKIDSLKRTIIIILKPYRTIKY